MQSTFLQQGLVFVNNPLNQQWSKDLHLLYKLPAFLFLTLLEDVQLNPGYWCTQIPFFNWNIFWSTYSKFERMQ